MKSKTGYANEICSIERRAFHNKRINCIRPVTCAAALLLAIIAPSITVAGPMDTSATVKYPRYRMVVLGPLGGPNGAPINPAVALNNRGDVIAQASTTTPDPHPFLQDEFIWHGILSNATGAVHDLGALPGTNQSVPTGIAQNGLISGQSQNGLLDPLTGIPQMRAVFWDHDLRIVDLGTLGGYASLGNAVNSRGQVVGAALNAVPEDPDIAGIFNGLPAAQQVRAFLWQGGVMHDLGTLGGNNAQATFINEQGDVTGFSGTNNDNAINDATGSPTIHPFLWKNGRMQDLGTLGGTLAMPGSFNVGGPWGPVMNARGDVAGTSYLPGDAAWHAFLWSNGHMIDLGTLGGSKSEAVSINDRGQVVGRAYVTDTPLVRHAFLWENGTMTDLGTIDQCRGTAKGVNSKGQIVGGLTCPDDSGDFDDFRPFYVEKGKPMVDLNTLVDPPSDLYMDDAFLINERGEIYAPAFTPTGEGRAVLLVPLPGH
jgi:probable HAF family extracellular repeat protein